jgi:hypothetical protein
MRGTTERDGNDDALMRWEWEGGSPNSASEAARAEWLGPAHRHGRRVEVNRVVASGTPPPAESGRANV